MSAEKHDIGVVEAGNGSVDATSRTLNDPETTKSESLPKHENNVKWWLLVLCVVCCTLLYSLDNSIISVVSPVIVRKFGHPELLPWCALAYSLCGTATILPWGQFFKIFNVKWAFIIAVIVFEIGSAICGAAPTMNAFIVGRAIAGCGGTGVFLGGITIFSLTTTERERPLYMGLNGLAWAFGMILGPLIGGGFAQSSATWRWGFYINLPIAAVFAPVMLFFIPSADQNKNLTTLEKAKRVDTLGTVLSAGAFASGIMALSFGGVLFPWGDRRIIAMFILSGVLFSLFFTTQHFKIWTTEEQRIFPMEFWKDRTLVLLGALIALGGGAMFTAIYYLPPLFQFVDGDSAVRAAVRLLPLVSIGVAFILINGVLMPRTGYYKPWFIVGSAVATVAAALLYTIDENTSKAKINGYTVLLGAGIGSYYQACITIAQVTAGEEKVFGAIAFIAAMQSAGIVLALGLSGAIYINMGTHNLRDAVPSASAADIRNALLGTGSTFFASLSPSLKEAVLHAIVRATDDTFIFVLASAALSFVLSCFLRWEKVF